MSASTPTGGPKHISRGLVRLMMAMEEAYTQVSREVGLTAQQAQLLCTAQRSAPVGDIAEALGCDRSNVTRLVDRVAGRGFIHRRDDESDGRVKLVELSPEGQRLVQRFMERLGSRLETLLVDWPQERQEQALDTLYALADALESSQPARTTRRRARAAGSARAG